MMTFLHPPDALIPKNPIFFTDFWVLVTSEARRVNLGRILGVSSIKPLGGVLARGLYPPPPPIESPPRPICDVPFGGRRGVRCA